MNWSRVVSGVTRISTEFSVGSSELMMVTVSDLRLPLLPIITSGYEACMLNLMRSTCEDSWRGMAGMFQLTGRNRP